MQSDDTRQLDMQSLLTVERQTGIHTESPAAQPRLCILAIRGLCRASVPRNEVPRILGDCNFRLYVRDVRDLYVLNLCIVQICTLSSMHT